MGIYLNPGNRLFAEVVGSEIYVDKTELIKYTNKVVGTLQKYICITRPRRFGKSMAANMLAAYYGKGCDSRELFEPYKIAKSESYEKNLNQYNVIALNMQDFLSVTNSVEEFITYIQTVVLEELREYYSDKIPKQEKFLSAALEKLFSRTGESFVFIIDEWDCILREKKYATEDYRKYLDFIGELLKDKAYVSLAYMTGILPIKKYGTHSGPNMFDEYSMVNPKKLAEFTGFTEEEVKELCSQYDVDFAEMKKWYGGYSFKHAPNIYNPFSVIEAVLNEKFASYWTRTETGKALSEYIDADYDGLKEAIISILNGNPYRVNTRTFQNDMTTLKSKDDVLTLLVHLGYLAYQKDTCQVFIPNEEIRAEFVRAIKLWNVRIDDCI